MAIAKPSTSTTRIGYMKAPPAWKLRATRSKSSMAVPLKRFGCESRWRRTKDSSVLGKLGAAISGNDVVVGVLAMECFRVYGLHTLQQVLRRTSGIAGGVLVLPRRQVQTDRRFAVADDHGTGRFVHRSRRRRRRRRFGGRRSARLLCRHACRDRQQHGKYAR